MNYFILPILGTLMWTATLGVSIKNLMRERERNVEQVRRSEEAFRQRKKLFVSLDDENYGSEFGVEFSLLVNQFVGSDGRRFVGRCQ